MLLKNAQIVDGIGSPQYLSNIRIENNIIVEIGQNLKDDVCIDCEGKLVIPGFFDIHTHYDAELLANSNLHSSTNAGVSHVIIGNCGVGIYPVNDLNQSIIYDLLEGVEDIPKRVYEYSKSKRFNTFKEYLFAIRQSQKIKVDSFLAYSCVRSSVLGENSFNDSYQISECDLDKIRNIIMDAYDNGALGISLSLSKFHKTVSGQISPSYYTTSQEFELIYNLSSKYKKVVQLVSDLLSGEDDLKKFANLSTKYNAKTLLSMQLKNESTSEDSIFSVWQKKYKEYIDIQIHTRANGIIIGNELPKTLYNKKNLDYKFLFPIDDSFNYYLDPSTTIFNQSGGDPETFISTYILRHPNYMFFIPNFNYTDKTYSGIQLMLAEEKTLIGLSDAGAHQTKIADSSLYLWTLLYWQKHFSVEYLVKKMTYNNAKYFGFENQHKIEVGSIADINIIDMKKISIGPPTIKTRPYLHLAQEISGLERIQDLCLE